MMTNTEMSVFNKYTDSFTKDIVYKKHVINKAFWDDSKGVNLNRGYDNADEVNVFIPKEQNDMSEYVKPKHYNGIGWTLKEGDFIIKGLVTENEVSGIKDLSNYEAFVITMVDDKDFGTEDMHHFEIRGK